MELTRRFGGRGLGIGGRRSGALVDGGLDSSSCATPELARTGERGAARSIRCVAGPFSLP